MTGWANRLPRKFLGTHGGQEERGMAQDKKYYKGAKQQGKGPPAWRGIGEQRVEKCMQGQGLNLVSVRVEHRGGYTIGPVLQLQGEEGGKLYRLKETT